MEYVRASNVKWWAVAILWVVLWAPNAVRAKRCPDIPATVWFGSSTRSTGFIRNPIPAGQPADLRVEVYNRRGAAPAPAFTVSVRSTDGREGPWTWNVPNGALRPGSSVVHHFRFTPVATGVRRYEIRIHETRCLIIRPPNPVYRDLQVGSPSPPPPPPPAPEPAVIVLEAVTAPLAAAAPGSTPHALIQARVRNQGAAPATFDLVLTAVTPRERIGGETRKTVTNLAPGEARTVEFRFQPGATGGRRCYQVAVERLPANARVSGVARRQACLGEVTATPAPAPPPAPSQPVTDSIVLEVAGLHIINDGDPHDTGELAYLQISIGNSTARPPRCVYDESTGYYSNRSGRHCSDRPLCGSTIKLYYDDYSIQDNRDVPLSVIQGRSCPVPFASNDAMEITGVIKEHDGLTETDEMAGGDVRLSPQEWRQALQSGRVIEIHLRPFHGDVEAILRVRIRRAP